jgi:hypothetical protein
VISPGAILSTTRMTTLPDAPPDGEAATGIRAVERKTSTRETARTAPVRRMGTVRPPWTMCPPHSSTWTRLMTAPREAIFSSNLSYPRSMCCIS